MTKLFFFCIPRNNNKTYTEKPHTVSENKRATNVISATIRKIMTTTYCLMIENCWNYSEQCWRKAQFQKQNNTPLPPPKKITKQTTKKNPQKSKTYASIQNKTVIHFMNVSLYSRQSGRLWYYNKRRTLPTPPWWPEISPARSVPMPDHWPRWTMRGCLQRLLAPRL